VCVCGQTMVLVVTAYQGFGVVICIPLSLIDIQM